ncbi:uncharacterized protein ATNIH1004_011696 [Aspergillus tanneri]|uniref:Uncharacterized protein n=1 Tax=Aspergillus tanneri TaxID=1220188 RepID=A0A5M9M7T0_9EURO|nr:uncharacterized protein ATNIH1004_011696 [Aspergillus tanneri]KAA8641560.1 hypothetical protein ATNIH1004_011696 [Aspergillus tanneri]
MADPPAGLPEPLPTNTQETANSFTAEDFQPRLTGITPLIPNKEREVASVLRPRKARAGLPPWRCVCSSNLPMRRYRRSKHDQNVLQEQNKKLHEEISALRAQIDAVPPATPTRSWAAVVERTWERHDKSHGSTWSYTAPWQWTLIWKTQPPKLLRKSRKKMT